MTGQGHRLCARALSGGKLLTSEGQGNNNAEGPEDTGRQRSPS